MHIIKNENTIINLIKYGPILFILTISIIITTGFIKHQKNIFKHDIEATKKNYMEEQKYRVKGEIKRFIKTIKKEQDDIERILKKDIKERVYQAHAIATQIYENAPGDKDNLHTKEHTLITIKSALSAIKFNDDRGYIFIDDINGKKILHPIKSFEGKNFLEFKDAKGYQFVKKIVKTIKNKNESFDTYYWYKGTNTNKMYKKIGFYKYFEPYNLAIGTGDYKEDYIKELQKRLLKRIQNVKIGKNGYIFVSNTKGLVLSHINKKFIGTNRLNSKTKNGEYILQDLVNFAKTNKKGFMNYIPPMTPTRVISSKQKVSYVELFEDWDWIIGTGFYMEDLNEIIETKNKLLLKSNEEAIRNIIILSSVITIMFILLSFYISNIIKRRFKTYQSDIEQEIKKTIEKEKLLVQQSKMATMGEMIGSIAHQWKQPLSLLSISNSMVRMSREEQALFDEKQIDKAVDNIDLAINNISHTIDDFRNFFNPNKEKTLFPIQNAFDETFNLIDSQFKNSNIEIIKSIDTCQLLGSQNELQQTLINLLKNAKEELIKLDSKEKRLLFITSYEENNTAIIKVKDNAGGIPIELQDKIFDSYFTTKEKEGGSGIGLYMCKQIIEKSMKGTIEVINTNYLYENIKYKGAEFIIKIPLNKNNS